MGRDNDTVRSIVCGTERVLVLALLCGLVMGCAFVRGKYGDRFNLEDVQAIKEGTSTRSDVAARLGAPDRIIEINEHEIFQYYSYDVKWGTILFFSRANVKGQDLYVFFNNDGVVDDVVFGKPKPDPEFQFWPFGD